MEESKREEASFVLDFKKNQEKKYEQLLKARRLKLRSSVFDLPEFAEKPLVSVVILISSEDELHRAETFAKENAPNKGLQIALLYMDGLVLPEFSSDELTSYKVNLQEANRAMWLNQIAAKMSGKIFSLMTTIKNFDKKKLFEMADGIKDHENSQVYVSDFQGCITGITMACDAFYLARGLDELIEDVEISVLDLALRLEMLGSQVSASPWPILDIPSLAEKNVRKGRLTVNQESATFGDFR